MKLGNDRKTEHFKALTQGCHASALADHVISTGHNIKWDHFDILATGKSNLQCKIKETLLISELKPSLNENVVVARSYFFLLISFGSINFVIVFYLVTSSSLYFCFFLNVCNSYNRSLVKMYVVAYKTSSNTENFY